MLKRAVALYRVSTKQQLGQNNNILTQKQIVRDFIQREDWNLIREFTEDGISGFKVSVNDREALQAIKDMAINREFDVLVVYMTDRIGRISNEIPPIISFLNNYDISIWSVSEGEIKFNTHNDKLSTYLRYWQNEGESIKLSKRITDYHREAILNGRYRGGNLIPFGYRLVDNGTKNFKGRNVLDFEIDDEEAEVVKTIYSLSIENNYGQHRIAKYLNELGIKSKKGKAWVASSIGNILSNPIYKGQMHMYSSLYQEQILSPIQEHLIIIPQHIWEENRQCVENRSNMKKKKQEFEVKDSRPKGNNYGKMLLSGLAYCGHCGERLTTQTVYKRWTTKDGKYHKEAHYRYRCGSFYKRGGVKCDGQSTYSINRIEPFVLKEIKRLILELQKKTLSESFSKNIDYQISLFVKCKEKVNEKTTETNKQIKVLKDEVAKSLLGESVFEAKMLKELIVQKNIELDENMEELDSIIKKINKLQCDRSIYINFNEKFKNWDEKFYGADLEGKKTMLQGVLGRVTVYADNIEVDFNEKVENYKNHSR